jgi:Tfp pilus assembly protein PilO
MRRPTPLLSIDATAVALLAALTGALYVLGARPLLDARADARSQEVLLASREEESARVRRLVEQTDVRLAQVRQRLVSAPLRLQGLDQTNARLKAIADLAAEHTLELNESRQGEPVPDLRYIRVPIRITGGGTYRACTLFIHHLRLRFPDTGLAAIELGGDPSSDSTAVRFVFDLVWYAAPAARADAESEPKG